jgi:hypothetical protein
VAGDIAVFLGPTLPRTEAAGVLDALYLPPAEQGSVVRAMRTHRPRVIALIDGAFGKVPAVRHKEILWALAEGVHVFGAASMGALRAAELAPFGMRGHGFIYRWYCLTPHADDDEVAVAMTPPAIGSALLSEALVNMRISLRRAERTGILDRGERHALEELARATHFVDRSYPRLLGDARAVMPETSQAALDELRRWLPGNAVDQKREDALGLLSMLAREPDLLNGKPDCPPFRLTEAWAYDLEAAGLWDDTIADR